MNPSSLFHLARPDLFVILIIVLLLFGATKMPKLFRGLGQTFREFMGALTGHDGRSADGQQTHLTNRVLFILAMLAGVISIAFALEN